jgi:uncharacterized protein YjcR
VEVNGNPHRFKAGHIPGTAVLTPQNAIEIRELYAKGQTMLDIALTYGISTAHVCDIVNRKRWKNAERQVAA